MTQSKHRLQALDALRGIAALGVVLFHFIPYYDELYGHGFTPLSMLEFGRYGVHLFFMLSGFVIFMTLERTQDRSAFGMARAFRLLPALWIAIAITYTGVQLMGPADRAVDINTALFNLTLLHSFFGYEHVDGAYWSLVIEVTFYFWMAMLFYSVNSWQTLRRILLLWVMVSYVAIFYLSSLPPVWHFIADDVLFAQYAPLFVSGIILYQWYKHRDMAWQDVSLLTLSICHAVIAYPEPFNAFVIAAYVVFILAINGKLNFIANKITLWLGSLSYSLYLVHQNIGYGIIQHSYNVGLPGQVGVALAISAAFCLAMFIHYFVEKPALRWFKSRQQKPALVTVTN